MKTESNREGKTVSLYRMKTELQRQENSQPTQNENREIVSTQNENRKVVYTE